MRPRSVQPTGLPDTTRLPPICGIMFRGMPQKNDILGDKDGRSRLADSGYQLSTNDAAGPE